MDSSTREAYDAYEAALATRDRLADAHVGERLLRVLDDEVRTAYRRFLEYTPNGTRWN